jgi:hypothetical protein
MNDTLAEGLKFGHEHMTSLGFTPVVGYSCLLELMAWNDLYDTEGEADFLINGDDLTEQSEQKIRTSPAFHKWEQFTLYPNQKTIFYMTAPNGVRISYQPYFIRGEFAYANILDSRFFLWQRKHFDTLQTKTYKGTQYTIPYDPIGYLEEYYGKPWDDFEGRKGWHWGMGKNLQHLKGLPA